MKRLLTNLLLCASLVALCCCPAFAQHEEKAAPGESASVAPAHGHEARVEGAHEEEAESPELPNLITVLLHTRIGNTAIKDTAFGHFLHTYEKQLFMLFVVLLLSLLIFGTLGHRAAKPGKLQTAMEMIVEGFYGFVEGIIGPQGRKYTPFLGTLFIFILVNNLMGIVPLFAAATSKYQTTVTLAVIVFLYVHYNGIKESGFLHWLHHLAGSPSDTVGWALVPLMFPLHVIGELAKPLSLSLRLFGNIMGEDILIGVFLMLGISLMGIFWPNPLVGIPLHFPFFFLALLTSTIQALVFTLLSTIYIMMVLPHGEHEHEEDGHAEHAH